MIPKQLHLGKDGQAKLREGVKMFSSAVKSTLGPAGKTVLMESNNTKGGIKATKDGVSIAQELRFIDPIHDMAAVMMLQAAQKTATLAGDGTTTSVVETEAILDGYDKYITNEHPVEITRQLHRLSEDMITELEKMSIPVTGDMLKHVATISTNNDPELGSVIADVFSEVDIVTVEDSKTGSTYTEVVSGLKIDKGYTSRHFITDPRKAEAVLHNVRILFYDREIHNLWSMEGLLKDVVASGDSFLIVGTLSDDALSALNYNVLNNRMKWAAVAPPDFGYRSAEKMEDLAEVLGGRFFSDSAGDDLQLVKFEDLGFADKVVISESLCIIEPAKDDATRARLEDVTTRLKDMLKAEDKELSKKELESRIEAASGGYGVIYVGAETAVELKEKRDRIDDAVCAIRAAKEEGVLPGGGIALMESFSAVNHDVYPEVVLDIMAFMVNQPLRQMIENSGIGNADEIVEKVQGLPDGAGYNVKSGEFCQSMVESGIIDPAKVTKSALRSAISVATTILNTECIITNIRETLTEA